jgi:predicted RNA-binding protein (virulence factor B family)
MLNIGRFNELVVERQVEFGFYLNPKADEVLLPAKYAPDNLQPGDTLRVFVYTDSEDRPVATTLEPKAVVGAFACLEVKDITPFGAFLDWGLEKDLLVPATEQEVQMQIGKTYVVKVCLDRRTNRVYATSRIGAHCDKAPADLSPGQPVDLLIYSFSAIGILAVVNNRYGGMLYRNETFEPLSVGDRPTGYIKNIRADGKIDLCLKRPGDGTSAASGQKIIAALKQAGGFLPFHDKSPPEAIKTAFSMSKKEFKRSIGGLYKTGDIEILKTGIRLKP